MDFTVNHVLWENERETISQIRTEVFVQEQNVDPAIEVDGKDELDTTLHFVGRLDGAPVATGRVLENGKIGRVSVLKEYRGKGFGEKLLKGILKYCLSHANHPQLFLHAQLAARSLYLKCGFVEEGDMFYEANIEHIRMFLPTSLSNCLENVFEDSVLRLERRQDFSRHIARTIAAGTRFVDILSGHLDPEIFNVNVSTALSKVAREHRNMRVRILVQDTRPLVGVKHPIVELFRRLPSAIALKRLKQAPQKADEGYVVTDRRHMVFFNNEKDNQGFANYSARPEAENRLDEFEYLWQQHSESDPNLGRLTI